MKYEVTLREIEVYVLDIEADSEEDAIQKAWCELSENGKDRRGEYHNDTETGNCDVFEIEE